MWPFTRKLKVPTDVQQRHDSWESAVGNWGMIGGDKRQALTFIADQTDYIENAELWRNDDLGGRIVETIPNEMTRQGYEISIEGDDDKSISKKIHAFLDDLEMNRILWTALCFERAYGGAGIMLGVNDLQDMSKPLNPKGVQRFDWMEVFEPAELQAVTWQNDPTQKGFGRPLTYRLNPISPGGSKIIGVDIHHSRLIIFPGIRVSRRQVTTQAGWGDATLTRCRATLRDFQTAWNAAGVLVNDFSQSIYKIKGLAELISLDKDAELQRRIRMMEYGRTVARAMVLDSDGEEFERKTTQITGLPELLTQFATRLAAAADMPVTLLMGMSPAGLNATGDSDIRTFYDRIKSMQDRKLRPAIERTVRLAFQTLGIDEPDSWHIDFNPLWQPTDQEIATTRLAIAQADKIYIDESVVSDREVRLARFGGPKFSMHIQVDPDVTIEPKPAPVAGAVPQKTLPPATKTGAEEIDDDKMPDREDSLYVVNDTIEADGDKWVVMSKEGVVLDSYDTEEEAQDRLHQIEHFKTQWKKAI